MSAGAQTKSGYLYGCRGIVITPLLATGLPDDTKKHAIKTAQKAGVEVQYEDGERSVLRGGDILLAVAEEDDTIIGAKFTFTNAKFDAAATTIIAGGTVLDDEDPVTPVINGWAAPLISDPAPAPFLAEVYASNFTSAGKVDGYIKIKLPFCRGRAASVQFGDKEWSTPEFEIKARENGLTDPKQSCYSKQFVTALPAELS